MKVELVVIGARYKMSWQWTHVKFTILNPVDGVLSPQGLLFVPNYAAHTGHLIKRIERKRAVTYEVSEVISHLDDKDTPIELVCVRLKK